MSTAQALPLGRDLPCPHCGHPGHRWTPCDVCACGPHDLTDSVEP